MKRFLLWALSLSVAALAASCAPSAVGVGVQFGGPGPDYSFVGPPQLVVIPGTYVYAAPDLDFDLYFYGGWYWTVWDGSWYRSQDYDTGWVPYRSVPSFYRTVPPGWRHYVSDNNWEGYTWNYQRIPESDVRANWKTWLGQRRWEGDNNWGVQGYNPKTRQAHPQQSQRGRGRGREGSGEED